MDAIGKIRSVMQVLQQQNEKQLWIRLRDAVKELAGEVRQAHESEISDIKRLAGIVEFAPSPGFGPSDGGGNSSVPMSERLESIAQNAQGVGRIDQHQIEEIFRAAQILKGMGQ